jgi:hypothetical protein
MESTNNEKMNTLVVDDVVTVVDTVPDVVTNTNTEQKSTNVEDKDGFTTVIRGRSNNKNVTTSITLEKFKSLLSQDKIVFYDKSGKETEFFNDGVFGRRSEIIYGKRSESDKEKDKDNAKPKFTVSMNTYLHLMGDIIVMEWFDNEVKYTTKLNHADLKNWSSKMYWKTV